MTGFRLVLLLLLCCIVGTTCGKNLDPSPIKPPWRSPAPTFASSWFGGSLTGFEWNNTNELAELKKYKLVLTGWMELLKVSNFTNGTAIAVEQATHLKTALGDSTAVFSYQSAWLAAAFYPEVKLIMDNPAYQDFFLLGQDGKPMNDTTYCAQTNTPPFAGCISYFFNFCNETAVDYYVANILKPIVADKDGKGYNYDGVFLDNSDGFNPRGSINANCNAFNATMSVHIKTAQMFKSVGKWPVFSTTLTGAGDIEEQNTIWGAGLGYTRFWEFFSPTSGSISALYNETARGVPTIVHAPTGVKRHPPIHLNDSLASFLIATGGAPYSYFQYSSGWYDNNWRWSPLYDIEYGTAIGPPMMKQYGPNMTGELWTRKFSSGTEVTVDCQPPQKSFAWCVGSFKFP